MPAGFFHGAVRAKCWWPSVRRLKRGREDPRTLPVTLVAGIAAITDGIHEPVHAALRAQLVAAVGLILSEHKDWHMLVRPHHLPLG
jgi:hypothetical protein